MPIKLRDFIDAEAEVSGDDSYSQSDQYEDDELKGFFMKYRKHFVIIMNKSRGTRYEAYKDRIIDFLVRNALDFFKSSDSPHPINTDKATVHLIRIIYSNMVHGFISIAQTFESEQEIERSYQLLLEYHYFGIRQFV